MERQSGVMQSKRGLTGRVLKAIGIFGSVEMLTMFCAVVRTKIAAICIGTAGVGLLGIYSTVIELLSTISQLGLRTTAVRDIASTDLAGRKRIVSVVLSVGNYLTLAGILLSILASPLLSLITFGDYHHFWPFLILAIAVGCNTVISTRSAILQGIQNLKPLARASALSALLSLAVSIPMILVWKMDAIVPVLLTYGLITAFIFLFLSRRHMPGPLPKVSPKEVIDTTADMIRLGAYLTVSGAASWLTSYAIMSYLNHAAGENVVGLYQSGYTLTIKYVGVIFTALAVEYFPRLSAALSSGKFRGEIMLRHETLISVTVISAVSSLMIAFAPWVVRLLYSSGFEAVVPMVILAAPGVVLRAVSWAMAFVILAKGKGKEFLLTELMGCAVSFAAMALGYRFFDIPGLGLGFTLWYLLYTLMVWAVTKHCIGVTLGRRVWTVCTVVFITVSALSTLPFFANIWLTVAVALGCSATSGLALWRMMKRRNKAS